MPQGRQAVMNALSSVDNRTDNQLQAAFLLAYMETRSISKAAQQTKITIEKVSKWRLLDLKFKESFREVALMMLTEMEEEAYRRAVSGVKKPVFFKGEICGEVTEYSDSLLMFLLKAANPKKYRDKLIAKGGGSNKNNTVLILPSNGKEIKMSDDIEDLDGEYDDSNLD